MYTIHRNLQIATGKYLVAHPTVLTSFRPLYAAETRIRLVVIKDYECVRRRNFNTDTLND